MKQELTVPPEAIGERADKFIAAQLTSHSRSFWQKQFPQGLITQNGRALHASDALQEGTLVVETTPVKVTPPDLPIVYEDDDVIVINKPTGVLTHAKGATAEEGTVADFIRPHTTDGQDTNRPGIVHRLDRDTSGILIAAKHNEAKRWLQKQFAERKVKKEYTAIVEGRLEPPEALLRLPLERNPKTPQKFRVGANGKTAETAYSVEKYLGNYSLVTLKPHTGRTHQLRVHMTYVGNPIVGDRLYGKPAERLFLHATALEITLPNKKRHTFKAPLPPEFNAFIKAHP